MRSGTIGRSAARILLITFILVLIVVPAACSESTSVTSVSVSMADRNVKEGETVSVEIRISTDTPCRGAQCVLGFDPALMKCDSVVEGGFLKDWAAANGASTLMIPQSPTIDNSQGHVSVTGIAVIGVAGGGGAKGSGVLFTCHFTALADGTAEPTLSDVVVIDVSGQAIPEVEVNN